MPQFSHLHVHTQYSLLDGAASPAALFRKAQEDGMPAVAITDHGNMFGVFKFVAEAGKYGIKPIIGCEFYLVEDRHRKQFSKDQPDRRYHQLLLAKTEKGYQNLSKLCSLGFIDGFYGKFPRIDHELLDRYREGLIATSCCLGAEIPQAILDGDEALAERRLKWWLARFEGDYYIELQRHKLKPQEKVNEVLLRFARQYQVPVICSNDSHYVNQADYDAHDILLCLNMGELKATPVYQGEDSMPKGYRFGFANDQFYFKTKAEMATLFADIPEALENTQGIVDACWSPKLERQIMLPNFPLPEGFTSADAYLEHLTLEGALKRYGEVSGTVADRIRFELEVIARMGFAGYFLIVQDFIRAGRELGVAVGPGRGSAAGSVVAYAIGITNIDPIKYSLLFERFLNPERVSMPDMDIDFDDQGRERVIDYVVDKYGRNQVAQIITFGSMAAKSSIKDVARVLNLPLAEANALAKLVPERPGTSLKQAFEDVPELRQIYQGNPDTDLRTRVLREAEKLEGSVRNTGIHAAGLIIAPSDLTECVPVSTSKDSDLLITQYDGKYVESAGMLKMDFLGLKTLSILKEACALIEQRHGITLDLDQISLEDETTYRLYQLGDTVATFQFESDGMRQYLRELKPTSIEDLVAMNALYRPGPMAFIPQFCARKHGREVVEYPHEMLEPILRDTYGIMVYQEQIMQTAQIMAGYSLGGADMLRRAMGKKDKEKMAKERVKFVEGAAKLHQIPAAKAEEVFGVMEKFAEYGFNRSHAAAYSLVAYQTGYLKANYPAEYMAAVLTHNIGAIETITLFIEECRRMGLEVKGPDVNISGRQFTVDAAGAIRFGLAAIKGAGEGAVELLINERDRSGPYLDIYDLCARVNSGKINRKTLESLAFAGAFDSFGLARECYLADDNGVPWLERVVRYGQQVVADKSRAQASLFGGGDDTGAMLAKPRPPVCTDWTELERLGHEREVTGFYLSGHPLDGYRLEIDALTNCTTQRWGDRPNQEVIMAGIVATRTQKRTKSDKPFLVIQFEDFDGSTEITLFGQDMVTFGPYFEVGHALLVRAGVRPRFASSDQFELRPIQIHFLHEAGPKLLRGLRVVVEASRLSEVPPEALSSVLAKHSGSQALRMVVCDGARNVSVELTARQYRIAPSQALIEDLAALGMPGASLVR